MPKCMGVDMGQAVTLAEFCQPVTDISREHGRTVLPWKQVIMILPFVSPPELLYEAALHFYTTYGTQQAVPWSDPAA